MEDNVRQDLRKCTRDLEEIVPDKQVEHHRLSYEHVNKLKTRNVSSVLYQKRSRSGLGINSKSDSWFVVGSNNQKVNMIIPTTNDSQLVYFHCGDVGVVSKYSRRVILSDEELLKRIKPCQDYENKLKELKKYLENNLEIADLKINIYMSACDKHCLSPYPSYIIEESAVGMESLSLINDFIPPVSVLKHYLKKSNNCSPNEHVVNVLHWLLVTFSEPNFNNCDQKNFERILNKVDYLVNVKFPTRIFVFKYKRLSEGYWQSEKGELGSMYAFLPINMEHAHSVAHLGVHPQIFIEGCHGLGLYLTTDLAYCIESTPAQWVWGKSMLGIECQIIMQVEFIKHPNVITYEENRALLEDENLPAGDIATGKWYFVPSHRLVRARYMLLYVKTLPATVKSKSSKESKTPIDIHLNNKYSLLFLTVTLSVVILIKRDRFTSILKRILASFAALPLIRHCLSIV